MDDGVEIISRRSLHHQLVDKIRELITKGELAPGRKVPEKELCERFGVSRTPLREALKVLASEGILTLVPHRGATVNSLSVAEIDEVFPIMGSLEALSGELVCQRALPEEIAAIRALHAEMLDCWQRRDLQPYFRLNQLIHESILQATRNETLIAIYRGLSTRLVATRYMADMTEKRWARAVAEHEQMVEALEARDGPRLARVLRKHLANKQDTVREWLERQNLDGMT